MLISNAAYLKDFVHPVSICQPETDLGSILKIFQHLKCNLLAIPQNSGGWGIINSEDLLSLIAKTWLAEKMALVSHPKSEAYQRSIPYVKISDFDSIIKPALICQADTQLDEFLNYLHYESLFDNQGEYLIVNAMGELQGKLDRNKIFKYLVKKSLTNTPQLPASLNYLSELIDFIALPLKIETVEGKDLYLNRCWQELITSNQDSQPPLEEPDAIIATWWMEQQLNSGQQDCEQQSKSPKLPDLANGDRANSNCHTLFLSDILPEIPNSKNSELFNPNSNEEYQQQLSLDNSQRITIEQVSDWNYLKISLVAKKQLSEISDFPYRLVIATKTASTKSFNPSSNSKSKIATVSNKLLTTIGHELKSPVTGIVGLSSLLQGQKLGQLNQRQAQYVKLIQSSGQKMRDIVDDLLKLTNLAAQQLLEPELINLEFLCQQLYQQALTKVYSASLDSSFQIEASRLKLDIESGNEIAIANKLFLSCILFHLVLETIRVAQSPDNLKIDIKSLQGLTAIVISSDLGDWSSSSENSSSAPDSGLDLVIAEYLAEVIHGSVTSLYLANRCQFTLLLPKDNTQHQQLSGNSIINPADPTKTRNLTILCLYPELEAIDPQANHRNGSNFDLKNWSDNSEQQVNCQHRIIEADSLEQAHTLARIWQLDVIVLDGYQIIEPAQYLRSLQESEYLAALPLITLDGRTTEAANQIEGLNVYPCLLPAEHRSVDDLMQVIQIATRI